MTDEQSISFSRAEEEGVGAGVPESVHGPQTLKDNLSHYDYNNDGSFKR